ncbi:MAG TPA: hypothetical protein VKV95_09750 [Terriglobia bacterium]|nr:hypothetical protein [Terriglobia bacterium]
MFRSFVRIALALPLVFTISQAQTIAKVDSTVVALPSASLSLRAAIEAMSLVGAATPGPTVRGGTPSRLAPHSQPTKFFNVFWPTLADSQTSTLSGSQAAALLGQSAIIVVGPNAPSTYLDFTATGTITYFWAGEKVQGAATVRGRGVDQFRLDANLQAGTRSYAVSHGVGALKDSEGNLTAIPYHNTVNIGVLTFPFPTILARLNNLATTITDMGPVTDEAGTTLHQIRVQALFSSQIDPDGSLGNLTVTDYFVDPTSKLLAKAVDSTHPIQTLTVSYPHEIDYEDYQILNGVDAPTTVREKVGGQTIWELHITGLSFNTGLTDSVFVLQ